MFKTIKYCPSWSMDGFSSIEDDRCWIGNFVDWYNNEYKHSGIKYVTPQQRQCGLVIEASVMHPLRMVSFMLWN
ncbi:integrase core domain-containing protein [Providencia stuartii]|nr:transposase [Providencia stuartii]QIB31648.1 transposase [Providencia stuartii]QPN40216.1 transposase [Providencia sp. 2.29]HEM8303586.1 transposase [Providencia stuartii]